MSKNNDLYVRCPICGEGVMEYKKIDNPFGTGLDEQGNPATHAWICDTCPGVLVEWYNHNDTAALDKYLRREDGLYE